MCWYTRRSECGCRCRDIVVVVVVAVYSHVLGVTLDLNIISNCLPFYLLSVFPVLLQRDAHVNFQWFTTQTFYLP